MNKVYYLKLNITEANMKKYKLKDNEFVVIASSITEAMERVAEYGNVAFVSKIVPCGKDWN